MPQTYIKIGESFVKERNSSTVTAYFRNGSAAEAPTTVHYRIDDITTRTMITDWTSVTAAASVSITVKSAENKIVNQGDTRERRQITVSADKGTTTETRDTAEWFIENIGGFDE